MTRLAKAVTKALDDAGVIIRQVAEDAGLSYDTLLAYRAGRRAPTPETVGRIAAALDRRADMLRELAGRLRKEAGG